MKYRVVTVIAVIAILAVAGTAMAGWLDEAKARLRIPNNTKTIQIYLPAENEPRPELEVKDNGMLGYHAYREMGYREPVMWGGGASSVLYNPGTQNMLVLLSAKNNWRVYYTYHLKAEPMQKLLNAMSVHWEDYKAYLEKPTLEGEAKILGYADVVAALESVKDTAKRKDENIPSEMSESEAIAQARQHMESRDSGEMSDLDITRKLSDIRKTDARDAAFEKFLRGEDMSRKIRGESMFAPQISKQEEAAGAATKIRLYYLGAWFHAIADDYRPKVFKTVKMRLKIELLPGFITKREIADIFAEAEKTAVIPKEEQAFLDPKHVFTGTVHVEGKKMTVTDSATGRKFPLQVTDQLTGMVAIGELDEGGVLRFRVKADEATFVPSLKQPMKFSGRIVEVNKEKSVIKIRLFDLSKEADFYVLDNKVRRFVPDHGIVEFTARNMEILKIQLQR